MKTLLLASFLVLPAALWAADPPYTVVSRAANERLWQRTVEQRLPDGRVVPREQSYIEYATGLHYATAEGWKESSETLELLADGAVARHGPIQMLFADNPNQPGALTVFTPQGRRYQTRVLGLVYADAGADPAAGRACLIAPLKEACVGELLPPGQVIYRGAFEGTAADLRYTYKRSGYSQDVILRQQLPDPALYGFNGPVQLQVWTELTDPEQWPTPSASGTNAGPARLDLQGLALGRGRAFPLEAAPQPGGARRPAAQSLPISTRLHQVQDSVRRRHFLIEEIDQAKLRPQLEGLPAAPRLSSVPAPRGQPVVEAIRARQPGPLEAGLQRSARLAELSRQPGPVPGGLRAGGPGLGNSLRARTGEAVATGSRAPAGLAGVGPGEGSGFVLDYETIVTPPESYTLRGDRTYFFVAPAFFTKLTIEGAAVAKFTNGASITIYPNLLEGGCGGVLDLQTSPYRVAHLTSMHDDSLGDPIAGSTGHPADAGADVALQMECAANCELAHLRIAHAGTDLCWHGTWSGMPMRLSHAQITDCGTAIRAECSQFRLRDVLLANVGTALRSDHTGPVGVGEHLTVDRANVLNAGTTLRLTNCLLVAVTNASGYTGAGNQEAADPALVFQTVGGGGHYLTDARPYRGVAVTNFDPTLRAELAQRTTYPPVFLSNAITTDLVLSPQARRDTGPQVDVGYHYAPLDYILSGVTVASNVTLLATNGVALGLDYRYLDTSSSSWYPYHGVCLEGGAFLSEGSPTAPNHVVRAGLVQETASGYPPGAAAGFCDGFAADSREAVARFRFTEIVEAAGEGPLFGGGACSRALEWSHGAIWNARLQVSATNGLCVGLTNNSFQRGQIYLEPCGSGGLFHGHNNLFRFLDVTFYPGDSTWTLGDNFFDQSLVDDGGLPLTATHNAYFQATNCLSDEEAPMVLTHWTYQAGPLGPFYQPTNSALLRSGSRSGSESCLYHFTTQLDQQKAATSPVSIGVHYAALALGQDQTTVWFDDDPGANWATWWSDFEPWSWITQNPPPASGQQAHRSTNAAEVHQHYFYDVATHLPVGPDDRLFCYVYLYSNALPSTLMLQWRDGAGDFAHMAFWGQDHIPWGPKLHVGDLPPAGGWMRLEVPAAWVGMDNQDLDGIAFTLFDGYAVFDAAGKYTPAPPLGAVDSDGDGFPDYLEDRNGSGTYDSGPGSGENDWQTYTYRPGLKVFTPLR